jgi:hypothetical protein
MAAIEKNEKELDAAPSDKPQAVLNIESLNAPDSMG